MHAALALSDAISHFRPSTVLFQCATYLFPCISPCQTRHLRCCIPSRLRSIIVFVPDVVRHINKCHKPPLSHIHHANKCIEHVPNLFSWSGCFSVSLLEIQPFYHLLAYRGFLCTKFDIKLRKGINSNRVLYEAPYR